MDNNEDNLNTNEPSKRVIFDSDFYNTSPSYPSDNSPKIINWVIKYSGGLVKNEENATYVVYGFIAISIIVSFFLVLRKNNNKNTMTPEQQRQIQKIEKLQKNIE